MKNIYRQWRKH